jgi:hypothetical protein
MPSLTVTEKEHWKERISQRIKKRIDTIVAQDPQLFDRIKREARQRALVSLGLAEMQTELEQIERQTQLLTDRETAIQRQLLAKVRSVPVDTLHDHYRYGRNDPEVQQTIERRSTVHEDELLAENEIGRQVVKLRGDESSVLDAVWLATSPRQLKTLWEKVSEFLGEEHSRLIADALTIESE